TIGRRLRNRSASLPRPLTGLQRRLIARQLCCEADNFVRIVGAVYDRTFFLNQRKTRGHSLGCALSRLRFADRAYNSYFDSGSGRTWNFTILLVFPFPPSAWNGVRVAKVVQMALPFQPAFG